MADWKRRALEAESKVEQLRVELTRTTRKAEVLQGAFSDIYWMARRYADGRKTYAPSMYNAAVDRVLALGITLQLDPCEGGNKLYASDGDVE